MAQPTDATDDTARTIEIDYYDAGGRRTRQDVRSATIGNEQLVLEYLTKDPEQPVETIECERQTKSVNQHIYTERTGRSRSTTMSSFDHHDRLFVLVSEDPHNSGRPEWTCYEPQVKQLARSTSPGSDYHPTQVMGVLVNVVHRTDGGRGRESGYKKRYKIERELLEASDEVWMIEFREEKGGSVNGSYSRVKNEVATKLVPSN